MPDHHHHNHKHSAGGTFFIIYLSFAISFGIYTNNAQYYSPCGEDSSTYGWAVMTFYSFIIGLVTLVLLASMLICCVPSMNEAGIDICMIFIKLICLAVGIMSLVCYGGLVYAYENEECGKLTTLIEVYVILVSIILGVLCLVILSCCCAVVVSLRERVARQQEAMLPQPERSNVEVKNELT